jgi:hypothetical protein
MPATEEEGLGGGDIVERRGIGVGFDAEEPRECNTGSTGGSWEFVE